MAWYISIIEMFVDTFKMESKFVRFGVLLAVVTFVSMEVS